MQWPLLIAFNKYAPFALCVENNSTPWIRVRLTTYKRQITYEIRWMILTKCGLIYRGNRTLDTKLCPISCALQNERFVFKMTSYDAQKKENNATVALIPFYYVWYYFRMSF